MAFKRSAKSLPERLGLTVDGRLLIVGRPPPGADGWPGVRVDADADVVVICPESRADIGIKERVNVVIIKDDGKKACKGDLWTALPPAPSSAATSAGSFTKNRTVCHTPVGRLETGLPPP